MNKIALLILISFNSLAQLPIDSATQKFTYSGVVEVDGDKNELYMRARAWFVSMYKDADQVIQLEDKESGKIIGKGRFDVVWQMGVARKIKHTVEMDFKDGKYRYKITNFMVYFSDVYNEFPLETVPSGLNSGVKNLYQRTHEKALMLEASLRTQMQVKSTPEDW